MIFAIGIKKESLAKITEVESEEVIGNCFILAIEDGCQVIDLHKRENERFYVCGLYIRRKSYGQTPLIGRALEGKDLAFISLPEAEPIFCVDEALSIYQDSKNYTTR